MEKVVLTYSWTASNSGNESLLTCCNTPDAATVDMNADPGGSSVKQGQAEEVMGL